MPLLSNYFLFDFWTAANCDGAFQGGIHDHHPHWHACKWAMAEWERRSLVCDSVAALSAALGWVFGQPVSDWEVAYALGYVRSFPGLVPVKRPGSLVMAGVLMSHAMLTSPPGHFLTLVQHFISHESFLDLSTHWKPGWPASASTPDTDKPHQAHALDEHLLSQVRSADSTHVTARAR